MMARPSSPPVDPAADAARLLRRLGFALLAFAPIAALLSRRGLVMVAPIGAALLILASALESEGDEPGHTLGRLTMTVTAAVAGFFVVWAGASLVWTPFPGEATARYVTIVALAALSLITAAALPKRMRASNLNLFPIGLGGAALLALVLVLRYGLDPALENDPALLDRVPLLFGLLLPPCAAWLLSKDNSAACFILAVTVTAALTAAGAYGVVAGLAFGGLIYVLAVYRLAWAKTVATVMTAGLVIAAPLIPFVIGPVAKLVLGITHPTVDTIRIWANLVSESPARLLTGHGFDTAARAKQAGLIPAGAPRGMLFETWYELGILGALALAYLLWRAVRTASRSSANVAPGALMTIVTAFTLAVLGQVGMQSWWLTMLTLAAILLIAVERGQYATIRPRTVPARPNTASAGSSPRS